MQHYQETVSITATPEKVFAYINDHARFSSHMSKSSWMMGGGHMDVSIDSGQGRQVGSHIKLQGTAFGMQLYVDEVITAYEPPYLKSWETVGIPKLLIIGNYHMEIVIEAQNSKISLQVAIDYAPSKQHPWLSALFSKSYAKWCVRQMIVGVQKHFANS